MLLKNLLFAATIFAGLILSPPEAFAGKRRKENKKTQREQQKKEQPPEDKSKTPPPPDRQTVTAPKEPPSEHRIPKSRDPETILAYFKEAANLSDKVTPRDKPILIEALDLLARTERGRWILTHPPDRELKFEVDFSRGPSRGYFFYDGPRKIGIWLHKDLFTAVANTKDKSSRREALLPLVSTLSHELTHYCQLGFSMWRDNTSTPDRTILYKIRELHARLEGEHVPNQLLELPEFGDLKARLDKSFFTKLKEAKLKTGASPAEAERFARTEFVKTFWLNNPDRPVEVGKERIFDQRQVYWNNAYNRHAFDDVASAWRPKYYRATGASIRKELACAAEQMGVDVTPDFFMKEKTFRYERGRLIGSVGGVKDLESDYLTVGVIHKRYANGKLSRIYVKLTQPKNGRFKEYWYGTKRVRATYFVKNGELSGVYLEYDYNGKAILKIPFKDGVAAGPGWMIQDGKLVAKNFVRNRCRDVPDKRRR